MRLPSMARSGLLLALVFAVFAKAQPDTQRAEDIQTSESARLIEKLVRAYNARDIDAFVPLFSEDVEFYKFPGELMFSGKVELIKRYGLMFKKLKCARSMPVKRIVQGDFVIDHEIDESCTEKEGVVDKRIEIITSYQVADGKIRRVLFFLTPEEKTQK